LPTQKNKRNFSTVTSRVRASPSRSHCRCQIPDEQELKSADYTIFRCPRPPNSCCRHNSSITATAVAAATPISKIKRSRHHFKITAQFHQHTVDHRRTSFTLDKTPRFHERMSSRLSYVLHTTCAYTDDYSSTAPGQTTRRRPPMAAWPVEVKVT